MSDSTTLEKVLEGAAALGALLAGALVGRATTAKRDVESDRAVTVLPPPPITLSDAELSAIRGRLVAVEGLVAGLIAERDKGEARRAHELEVAMNGKLRELVADLGAQLRGKSKQREAHGGTRPDPRRERDSE